MKMGWMLCVSAKWDSVEGKPPGGLYLSLELQSSVTHLGHKHSANIHRCWADSHPLLAAIQPEEPPRSVQIFNESHRLIRTDSAWMTLPINSTGFDG